MNFESAVRPFQRLGLLQRARLLPAAATSAPPLGSAFLAWGEAGAMPTPTSTQYQQDHCQQINSETTRTSDTVRIDGQFDSDGNPYIEVERAHQIKFDTSHTDAPPPDTTLFNEAGQSVQADLDALSNEIDAINGRFLTQAVNGGGQQDNCKLTVNLNNGATSA